MIRYFFWVLIGMIGGGQSAPLAHSKMPVVSLTQIADHPALNAVSLGIQEALKNVGYLEGETIRYLQGNAQGSLSLANQLIQAHMGQSPTVVVAISTPSAQAALKVTQGRVPVVFAAITDPAAAKLISDKEPALSLTGVTDLPPFDKQMAFIRTLLPQLKTLGFLYNPGEDNAVASLKAVQDLLTPLNIVVYPLPVNKVSDIGQSIQSAIGKVDALYIPNDNTAVSGIDAAIKLSLSHNIPLFAADILLVEKGCLGMIGVDYSQIGWQTGMLVKQVIEGVPLAKLPIENPKDFKIYLNLTTANKLGLSFDKALKDKADKIF